MNQTIEDVQLPAVTSVDPIDELTVTVPDVMSAATRNTNLDTLKGIGFWARSCRHVNGWVNKCLLGPDELDEQCQRVCQKCSNSEWEWIEFHKFQWYDYERADCLDPVLDMGDLAVNEVERGTPWAMAMELETGPWSRVNPTLQNSAIPLNTVPVSPTDGGGMLLEALDRRAFTTGTIFGARRTLPALRQTGSLETGFGGALRFEGLPFGPGIQGIGPCNDLDGNPTDTPMPTPEGSSWMYTVGSRVEYNLSPPRLDAEWVGHRTNQRELEALRDGVWRFNPLCAYAVLVCHRAPSYCGNGCAGGGCEDTETETETEAP